MPKRSKHRSLWDIPYECRRSQERAWATMLNKVCSLKADLDGNLDPEQYHLDLIALNGTAFGNESFRNFIGGVVAKEVATSEVGSVNQYVLTYSADSIWNSKERLDSFLKRLGRTLEAANNGRKKRGIFSEPDWGKVDKVDSLVTQGWCKNINVGEMVLPPLCWFTMPALFKLLRLCNPPVISPSNSDIGAFRQRITRLGLVSAKKDKFTWVKRADSKTIKYGNSAT